MVEGGLGEVVLDQQKFSADAAGVLQKRKGILGVMQDIHEQAGVEGTVGKGQVIAVEWATGNRTVAAGEDFDSFNVKTWQRVANQRAQSSITAADIQESRARRQKRCKTLRQHHDSSLVYDFAVDLADELRASVNAHPGRNPRCKFRG